MGAQPMRTVRRGFRGAPPAERAGFAILSASGLTVFAARLVTYAQERRRHVPAVRSMLRRAYHQPRSGGLRIHHFLPGMLVSTAAGAAAILTRRDGRELRFGWPFGVGAGLTLDEIALLVELDNPYWRSERVAILGAATASAGAAGLAARFHRRGARER